MKTKKSISILVLVFLIALLYIFFAIKPLGSEYLFEPGWKIDVANPTISSIEKDEIPIHFRLSKTMGYFTKSAKVVNFVNFPSQATISQDYYTFYNTNNDSCVLYKNDGTKISNIDYLGFPFIQEDRIFIFLPGGSSFAKIGIDGKKEWEYSGTIPITAFDTTDYGLAVGFADGSICIFTKDGGTSKRFSPGGSKFQFISGVALSKNGSIVATVCGKDKQRFVLAKNDGANSKIIFHEYLDDYDSFQKLVSFYDNDKKVVFNFGKSVGFVDVETGKSKHIKNVGQILDVQESSDLLFILSKSYSSEAESDFSVFVVEKFATVIGKFSFKAKSAFIQTNENYLYVGKNSSISQIILSKK